MPGRWGGIGMTRFLTLPKEFAARVRQTVMRPDTAESPPLEP
ncbi:MAG: hypothetical protein RIT14_901, partial [Pseudomonadota bacterium]